MKEASGIQVTFMLELSLKNTFLAKYDHCYSH